MDETTKAMIKDMLNRGMDNDAIMGVTGATQEQIDQVATEGKSSFLDNLGIFSTLQAAEVEPPSSQKFSNQFSVTQSPQLEQQVGFKKSQLFDPTNMMRGSVVEDVVDTPTREFGTIRAGQDELGIFGVPKVQDMPVDLEELAALEDDIIEQQLAAASRGEGETFFDKFRDIGGNVLDYIRGGGLIGRGITSLGNMLGDTFKGSRFYNPRTASGNRLFAPGSRAGDPVGLGFRRNAASLSRMLNRLSKGKMIGETRLADIQKQFGLEGIDVGGMADSIAESAQTGYGGYGSRSAAAAAAASGGRDYSSSPGAMAGDMEYGEE